MQFVKERGVDIAAIIIEPIQGEGGDNHFRGEWLQTLRRICDENEMLLIFDEVQCGMGATGRNWCCEHFGVMPDLMAFGKKAQVCGVMAGPRLDEVKDNCFPFAEPDQLDLGRQFHRHGALDAFPADHRGGKPGRERAASSANISSIVCSNCKRRKPIMTAVRGRGLFLAFDLPDPATRDEFWKGLFDGGVLALKSGERAIRFRPALDITEGSRRRSDRSAARSNAGGCGNSR